MSRQPPLLDRCLLAAILLAPLLAWSAGRFVSRVWLGFILLLAIVAGLQFGLRARRRAALATVEGLMPGGKAEWTRQRETGYGIAPWVEGACMAAGRRWRADAEMAAGQLVAAQLQLLSLHDVLRGVTAAAGPDQIVDALLEHCLRRCGAVEMRCYLGEERRRLRCRRLVFGEEEFSLDERELPWPEDGGLASVLEGGDSQLIGDPEHHPLLVGESWQDPSVGYLAVPLMGAPRGAVLGALVALGPVRAGGLAEGTRVWLESLGRAAGAVLENASLYARLSAAHTQREGILNSLASGLIAFDAEDRLLFHNRAAEEMLGLSSSELMRLTPAALCPELARPGSLLAQVRTGARPLVGVDAELPCPGRGLLTVRLTVAALPQGGGAAGGILCVFDDLTPMRAMQDEIRQLDKLAAIGRFTSSLAHEIRNPLAGIAAGIDYLRRQDALSDEHRESIRIISQEIDRLDRIIRHLFAVARPGTLMLRHLSLEPVLARVLACLGPIADRKGVTFRTDVRGSWRELECDEDQIQQVLLNLLKNAVEAEAEGGTVRIVVDAGVRDGESTAGSHLDGEGLLIAIENGGETIPVTDRERIFEPFYSRKPQGTGLGLFVSYNIVKQHGGTLAAIVAAAGRTRFQLFLPLRQVRSTEVA